jgi:uncharacterized protein (DUF952 family)/GNAT superfamily N-acetyltransferase
VSVEVLLHLTTPAEWRAALAAGALVPPSLAEAGFVHLSTPDQVHLPAGRLFPGRRDVVLLVVDPARLTAPVRAEPGVPGDPASMRFPHLYGPLPASAVVAVVPWRADAPLELPAPGDAAGRARALAVSLALRRVATVEDLPVGFAVSDPAFPLSREDNRVLLTGLVDADTVEAVTDRCARAAGWPSRAATLLDPAAGPVADELARRGWTVSASVTMARWLPGPGATARRDGDPVAEVVPQAELHGLWDRSWRREIGPVPGLDEEVGQLVGREHRTDRVVRVLDLAVRDRGDVVAGGQLRIDGATAAVESVVTEPAARRRGAADAVLRRALQLAGEAGCDLVVLDAAALDWPQHWYARRGFERVGRTWDVVRPVRAQPGATKDSSR